MVRVALSAAILTALTLPSALQAQEVKPLEGHGEPVAAVAYSPAGDLLATGSFDKTIRLWDPQTLQAIRALSGHSEPVLALAFSPDGARLLSGSADQTVRLWSLRTDKEKRAFAAVPTPVRAMVANRTRSVLALGGEDGVIRLLNATGGEAIRELPSQSSPVTALAFAASDQRLAALYADRKLRLWDVASGELQGAIEVSPAPAAALAVAEDGTFAITGDAEGIVRRWSLPPVPIQTVTETAEPIQKVLRTADRLVLIAGKQLRIVDRGDGKTIAESTAPAPLVDAAIVGDVVATVGAEPALRLWNLADGSPRGSRDDLDQNPTSVAGATDGQSVLVGLADGNVLAYALPLAAHTTLHPFLVHDAPLTALGRSADGSLLLTASADKTVRVWRGPGEPVRGFALFSPVAHAAIAPDGLQVAAIDADNNLRVWNISGEEVRALSDVRGPVTFSPDNQHLAVCGPDHKVHLHPRSFAAPERIVASHAAPIHALAFSPDGKLLASGGEEKLIKINEVASGNEVRALAGHEGTVRALAVSGDNATLISGGDDRTTRLWNLADGAPKGVLAEAAGPVRTVAINADGTMAVSGADDDILRLYDRGTLVAQQPHPRPVAIVPAAQPGTWFTASADQNLRRLALAPPRGVIRHEGAVRALASVPGTDWLISGADDKTIRVTERGSGNVRATFTLEGGITRLAVNANGVWLATADANHSCRVWNLTNNEELTRIDDPRPLRSLDLDPDAARLTLVRDDGQVMVHNLAGERLQSFTASAYSRAAVDDDGITLWLVEDKALRRTQLDNCWRRKQEGGITALVLADRLYGAGSGVVARDPATGQELYTAAVPGPTLLSLTPDGQRLACIGGDKIVRWLESGTGKEIAQAAAIEEAPTAIAVSPDGEFCAVSDAGGGLNLLTTPAENRTPARLQRFVRGGPAVGAVFFADKTFGTCGGDGIVRAFGHIPESTLLSGHGARVYAVAFSPDGARAATAGADQTILLWNLADGSIVHRLQGHSAPVYSVAFDPSGNRLVSGGGDRTAIVWDLATGKPAFTLSGAQDAVYKVAFVNEGREVLGGGVDQSLRVWSAEDGNPLRQIANLPDEVYGLAVSPNGNRYATSGYAGAVQVLDASSQAAVFTHQLNFGAYDIAYRPDGAQLAVAHHEGKVFVITLPEAAR